MYRLLRIWSQMTHTFPLQSVKALLKHSYNTKQIKFKTLWTKVNQNIPKRFPFHPYSPCVQNTLDTFSRKRKNSLQTSHVKATKITFVKTRDGLNFNRSNSISQFPFRYFLRAANFRLKGRIVRSSVNFTAEERHELLSTWSTMEDHLRRGEVEVGSEVPIRFFCHLAH